MVIATLLIFGLIIGSFLNVCIWRVPRKLSVISPARSYCPRCKSQLKWYENIPILSWMIQAGKCKSCKEPISGVYPLVEALSAFAALGSYMEFGFTPTGFLIFALTEVLIVITFIDLELKIIPNVITFPAITFGLCLGIVSQYTGWFTFPITQSALESLIGMIVGGGFFYVIALVYYAFTKTVGLGGGDIKLLAMTGSILGWKSVLPTIFAGCTFGAIIGIALIIMQRGGRKTEIPFGPWLSLGALLYIFTEIPWFRF